MTPRTYLGWAPALTAVLITFGTSPLLSAADTSDVKLKTFTSLPKRASVVLDQHCAELVQPYRLTDNFASIMAFSVEESIKGLPGQLTKLFGGSSSSAPASGKLSDETKLAAKQLNWMPMTAEVMYAERQHNQRQDLLSRDSKLGRKYYPTADKMLSDILGGVNESYDYKFKLFIVKTDNRNALALPGGYLYIDQGLLDGEHQPKAYFALAHEISHVLQRHETKEMQSMVVDSFSVKSELIDTMKAAKGNPSVIVDRIKLEKGHFTKHHNDQELQADSCAVKILSHVYPDRQMLAASITSFEKDLPKMEPSTPTSAPKNDAQALTASMHDIVTSPMLRHPNTLERKQNLDAIYREVTTAGP